MADLTPRFLEIRVYNPINKHLLRVLVAKYDFLHTLRSCLTSLQAKSQLDSELRIVSRSLSLSTSSPSPTNYVVQQLRETATWPGNSTPTSALDHFKQLACVQYWADI